MTERISLQLPLLLWMLLIYFFSTDVFSAGQTSHFIEPVLRFVFPRFSDEQIDSAHSVIRKLAHIAEYFILSVLAYRPLKRPDDPVQTKMMTVLLVLLVAVTDEFHQALTMYRGASVFDVGYDCLGGSLAMWAATALRK